MGSMGGRPLVIVAACVVCVWYLSLGGLTRLLRDGESSGVRRPNLVGGYRRQWRPALRDRRPLPHQSRIELAAPSCPAPLGRVLRYDCIAGPCRFSARLQAHGGGTDRFRPHV